MTPTCDMRIRIMDLFLVLASKYLYICCDQLGLSLLRQNRENTLALNKRIVMQNLYSSFPRQPKTWISVFFDFVKLVRQHSSTRQYTSNTLPGTSVLSKITKTKTTTNYKEKVIIFQLIILLPILNPAYISNLARLYC